MKVGNKEKLATEEDYEYVFDEEQHIDFIKSQAMPGKDDDDNEAPEISTEKKKGILIIKYKSKLYIIYIRIIFI